MYRYEIVVPIMCADDNGNPTDDYVNTWSIESMILELGLGYTRLFYAEGGWRSDDGTIIKESVSVYTIATDDHDKIMKVAEYVKRIGNQQSVYVCRTKADVFFI